MKHLKNVEDTVKSLKYKEGDYILLDVEKIKENNIKFGYKDIIYDNCGEIYAAYPTEKYPYVVLYYNDNQIQIIEDEIIRLLNQDEINDFLIKKEAKKYNL